jgi:dimethylaniline monooxygenase (N-oxide forming)
MTPTEFQEYMQSYAEHFDLLKDIVFGTTVREARRDEENDKWLLDITNESEQSTVSFDRVAFCSGYQTLANVPTFPGQDLFAGPITHAQSYRDPTPYAGKNIVTVGLRATTGDIVPDLAPTAGKIWVSHRRGALPIRRYRKGTPLDLGVTWRRRMMSQWLQRNFPNFARYMSDTAISFVVRMEYGKLDPAWRLEPFPSLLTSLPGCFELVIPMLKSGRVTSLHGIKQFLGPRSIEFDDGTVLDDVDAVIYCTGYAADWSVAPFVEKSRPKDPSYGGPDMYRMYMNLFPTKYADSMVLLNYSAYGKNNGFSFADVTSMAISNIWRNVSPLPPVDEMERKIDSHQEWVATRWKFDDKCDTSMVKQWEFQTWLHEMAGTGMENLGWGWKGWKFWFKDRKMYNLMNNGVETAHAFRYFETGKRKTWPGARDAIIHVNELVKVFPLKTVPWPPPEDVKS